MSIEIRKTADGRNLECDWGVIEHSCPKPERGELGPLMIISADYAELLRDDPEAARRQYSSSYDDSVSALGSRLFAHIGHAGKRWTWELFEAHWWDGPDPRVYVGRWPD